MNWRSFLVVCFVLLRVGGARSEQPAGSWKQIDDDEGIKVWRLEIPGVELPGFRGESVIEAPAERIVEELKQVEHHTEWMHNCAASEVIKRFDDEHAIIYNRTDTPWPVWDRDAVLDTQFTRSDGLITLSFKDTDPKLRALPDKVVRMPRLQGSYKLWTLAPGKTRVRYTVEVDIGGSVPHWLAERVARDMPYQTLSRLRTRMVSK
jgi:START domain